MIIWIDDNLFSGESRPTDLLCLLRNASTRKHTLLISDDSQNARNGTAPKYDKWRTKLSMDVAWEVDVLRRKTSRVSVNSVTRGRSKRLLVTNGNTPQPPNSITVSLSDAIRACALPLHIILQYFGQF